MPFTLPKANFLTLYTLNTKHNIVQNNQATRDIKYSGNHSTSLIFIGLIIPVYC